MSSQVQIHSGPSTWSSSRLLILNMPAPSLHKMCYRLVKKNIDDLENVGDLTYGQVESLLKHIKSPAQLKRLEDNSPHLRGEDIALWQAFIARDIPKWQSKNYKPNNPKSWSKVYDRYKREMEEEVARDSEALFAKMKDIKDHRESRIVRKVENQRAVPRLPRDPKMVGRDGRLIVGARGRENGRIQHTTNDMRFTEGSKTKMTSGAGVLLRAKREAKEIGRMNKLMTLTGKLGDQRSKVVAPQAMVDAHRRAALPIATRKDGSNPFTAPAGHGPPAQTSIGNMYTPGGITLEEKERRLREKKLLAAKREAGPKATMISDDEEDDYNTKAPSQAKSRISAPAPRLFSQNSSKPQIIRREVAPIKRKREDEEDTDDLFGDDNEDVVEPAQSELPSSPQSQPRRPMMGSGQRPMMKKKVVDVFNRGGGATSRNSR